MKRASRLAALLVGMVTLIGCSAAPNIVASLIGPCTPMLGFADLSWSPDGSRLALTVNINGFDTIFVMNRNGSGLKQITSGIAVNDRQPAWSPDGQRIAFSSDRGGGPSGPGDTEIYTMNADGSGAVRLTDNHDTNLSPSWSADGKRIAFLTMPHGDAEIDVMEDDGSHVSRLTLWRSAIDSVPDGVADGRHIAFVADHPAEPELYLLDDAGDNVSPFGQLNRPGMLHEIHQPDWSPGPGGAGDGKWIVFFADDSASRSIYRMAADGTQFTRLTSSSGGVDVGPKWSPDGKQIAFISFRDGYSEVYVMDADGSHQTRLTHNPANQKCLKWP